jgi:transposase
MRGHSDPRFPMFYAIDVEELIRPDHPLRPIKAMVDEELRRLDAVFAGAYSDTGRPGVPPEVLLKAMLLQALYSVRSERQLVERLTTDLLFRWFCDLDPAQEVFDHSAFSHNRQRLAERGLIAAFFDGVVRRAMEAGLTSDDHFTVDGTLIQSHAALKSLKPKAAADSDSDGPDGKGGAGAGSGRNPSVNFHGQKRSNATHQSTTDPQARLYRKGNGQPALLCHSGHALMENRNGLLLAVAVDAAEGQAERRVALAMLDEVYDKYQQVPTTLGADKGYASGEFLGDLVGRVVRPHVALPEGPIKGDTEEHERRRMMRRRMQSLGYALSQRRRKMIEESFGWIKTVAGLARTKLVGRWKLKLQMLMAAAAYNLVRMRRLAPA